MDMSQCHKVFRRCVSPRRFATVAAACLLLVSSARADTLSGKVIAVADGDTLTVLVGQQPVKIRVSGIDAPEKKQPFGQRAKQGLSDCAFGKMVEVDWHKTDRYGRTIGKVISGSADCGLLQIEHGLAWHYKAYAKDQTRQDRIDYANAENKARTKRIGLWSDPNPEPPWDFRHKTK